MRSRASSFVMLIFCLVLPLRAQQAPLAERVPAESIVYLGWVGGQSMPSEYQASHLRAVLDASNVPALFNDFIPKLVARTTVANREAGQGLAIATNILGTMWRHPTAFYFAGVDLEASPPMPRIGIVCRAGNDLQTVVDRLTQLKRIAAQEGEELPLNWVTDNDTISISIGQQLPPVEGGGLGAAEAFKKSLARVQSNGTAFVMYLDGPKLIELGDRAVQKSEEPELIQYWPKIINATGVRGLGRIVWASGFDGKDWADRAFIEAAAPRKGLLRWGDAPPVPDDLLRCVPESATTLSAGALDFASMIESVRVMLGEVDPAAQAKVNQGLGIVTVALGMDFQRDLLEPLGTHWVAYLDPSTGGIGLGGIVIVNKLDDPTKARQGLNRLATFVSNMTAAGMRPAGMSIPTRQTKVGDLTVTYLAAPLITPAWVIKDDKLYLALYPQMAASAARASDAGKRSILDNADFVAVRKRLAGANDAKVTSIRYADLRRTAPESYQTILMFSRLALGFADMWGVTAPELVLPPLDELLKHLGPTGSVCWADDQGYHLRSVSPFPGSELLGGGGGVVAPMIGASALSTSIMLPSLNRARETANRVKCASNLRQMGQAMLLHSNENRGRYPDTLGELLKQDLTLDVFLCPSGDTQIPEQIRTADLPTQIAWVNEHADYVYLGAGKTNSSPAADVLIHEKPDAHGDDGMNLLYGDGHVEFHTSDAAKDEIQRTAAKGL